MSKLKKIVKNVLPTTMWNWLGIKRRAWIARNDTKKSTREVFQTIYKKRLWGDVNSEGYVSGAGSRDNAVTNPYVEAVTAWSN